MMPQPPPFLLGGSLGPQVLRRVGAPDAYLLVRKVQFAFLFWIRQRAIGGMIGKQWLR